MTNRFQITTQLLKLVFSFSKYSLFKFVQHDSILSYFSLKHFNLVFHNTRLLSDLELATKAVTPPHRYCVQKDAIYMKRVKRIKVTSM